MTRIDSQGRLSDRRLSKVVRCLVVPEIARRRPERVLLISPKPGFFPALGSWSTTRLSPGFNGVEGPLVCNTAELPFTDGSFDVIILHHVFADGREPELAEAWRVLAAGGDLFVLGQGSCSWSSRLTRAGRLLPGLRARQMCHFLRRRAFHIEQCAGLGFGPLPILCERRWQRWLLPFADAVLIHGRHRPLRPIMRSLRFGRPQAVGVQSTAAEQLYRKAW